MVSPRRGPLQGRPAGVRAAQHRAGARRTRRPRAPRGRLNQKMYGAALAVPLGLTTRVSAPGSELARTARRADARSRADVVEAPADGRPSSRRSSRPTTRGRSVRPLPLADLAEQAERASARDACEPSSRRADADLEPTDRRVQAATQRRARPGHVRLRVGRAAARTSTRRWRPRTTDPGSRRDAAATAEPRAGASADDRRARRRARGRRGTARARHPRAADRAVPVRRPLRMRRRGWRADAPATRRPPRPAPRPWPATTTTSRCARAARERASCAASATTSWSRAAHDRAADDRVRPIAQLGEPVEPLVIDDFVTEPAYDPVIGPELAAARTRVGLSVDELADRTRIRPHVIESIEVDDFAPCGGDFYARGHIRTLARVLGTRPGAAAGAVRQPLRDRPDQRPPGLRGRAGHRR